MEEETLQPNGVYEYPLTRVDGEDRESLKVCDSGGNLALMLSFQEELAALRKKRTVAVGDGSAAAPIVFADADLDQALRRLRLLGAGAGGAS
jgi:hypothetical protein